MDALKNKKVKGSYTNNIYGISEIIHRIRIQAKLSCDEYILCQTIESFQVKSNSFSPDDIYRKTGFEMEQVKKDLVPRLIIQGFIRISENGSKRPIVTEKWFNLFKINSTEFDDFWIDKNGQFGEAGKIVWAGSKPQAKDRYAKVRQKFSAEYLLRQRYYYFKFLEAYNLKFMDSPRQKMMGTVFLNPINMRFDEDWKQQLKDLKIINESIYKEMKEE